MKIKNMLAMLLVCVMLLSACSSKNNNTTGNNTPSNDQNTETNNSNVDADLPEEENGYTGFKEYHGAGVARTTWNPQMYTNSKVMMNCGTIVAMLDVDGKLTFVPHHASELPTTEDGGTTWTIKFREGMTWSTGTPLDANDYYYTLKQLVNPKLVNKNATYIFDPVVILNAKEYFQGECEWEDVGVELVNDHELKITLQYPATETDFISTICSLVWPVEEETYEACMNADGSSTTYGTTLETTPSSGMFTLTEWIPDGHETLTRNDNDPLVKEGWVKLDSYNVRYVSSNTTRAEMFWKGENDSHSLLGDDYLQYKNDPRTHSLKSPNVWGFFMNGASKNPIMQSKDFRNAIHLGTPRERICQDVYKLYPAAAYLVSTGILTGDGYFRETAQGQANADKYATNEEKALELFDKAYEENGSTPVSIEYIYFEGQEEQKRQAEILQESLENLFGKDRFTMTLRAMQPAAAYDAYRAGDYDLGLGVRLANEFNPWATMNVWTTTYSDPYQTGFASEEFDKLQYDCMYGELATDTAAKIDALARMEELLLDYGAFCPVMQNDNAVMYHERIELASDSYLPRIGFSTCQIDITAAPSPSQA